MEKIKFSLQGGLSTKDIEKMWEGALSLIEKFGLRVPHSGIRNMISEIDGVKLKDDIAYFSQELVSRALKSQDYSDWPRDLGPNKFGMVSGAYELNVIDLKDENIRPANLQDLVDYTKLCDSYGIYGSAPVKPQDIPQELQEIILYKISYEYSSMRPGGIFDANPMSTPKKARYIKEMSEVVNKPFSLGLWVISPFLATQENLELLFEFRNEPVDMWVATMPVAGTTSPINMIDSYIQSIGELFSALTLVCLINETKPLKGRLKCAVIDSIRSYPFDMKYGAFVYGSPEDLLATLYQVQLNNYFGIPVVAKSLLTTSKLPDAHAAAEKSAHTLAAALAGAYVFTNGGLLSVDEIYSAEQLVIDYEIVQYCQRVVKGDEFDDDLSVLKIIQEVGHSSTFLSHDSTYQDFRKYWDPNLFLHSTLRQWQEDGGKKITKIAKEIALERIKNHSHEVDSQIKRQLDRIYERAMRDLCG
ncbi:MAG: trimethylamine methyltransferase family protein [Actinobacteria bacterium]|nr:trimethylamine methyltransferase family protein [Actinomycetota bacterium]